MSEKQSFDITLADLQGTARPSRASLQGLSDLSSREAERLKPVWERLDVDRRRWIAHTLSDLAEDNIELHFTTMFKVLLFDPDPEVRQAAVEGLWESDDLRVAEYLLGLLKDDKNDDVRAAAASALGHFAYLAEMGELPADVAARTRQALLAAVHGDASPLVRRRAVEAVGFISNDKDVWKVIDDAYASAEPTMRTSAVFAMGRNCDPRWLRNVIKEMDSTDPQMRFEAARAAGEIEDKRAVPKLLRLLVDPDTEVRLTTIQALGLIGGEQAIRALRYLVDSEDANVAEAAEEALAEAEFADSPLSFLDHVKHDAAHEHEGHDHGHDN